ncbi:hypothetical protein [[Kitasatospora] papulosa]|uniref:hypothetical protein n=1 Tax=[Kitasatospora] papulosa TaxID=1464011 RepID=UPI003699FFC5
MNPTLAPSQFTSPDIRTRGVDALPGAAETPLDLDMQQVQEELAAALRHIEGLRPRHPVP